MKLCSLDSVHQVVGGSRALYFHQVAISAMTRPTRGERLHAEEKFRRFGLAYLEIPYLIGAVTFAGFAITEDRSYWWGTGGCLFAAILSWILWPKRS